MGNILKERKYICKCGAEHNEYIWDTDLKKYKYTCSKCGSKNNSDNLVEKVKEQYTSIRTKTKNR